MLHETLKNLWNWLVFRSETRGFSLVLLLVALQPAYWNSVLTVCNCTSTIDDDNDDDDVPLGKELALVRPQCKRPAFELSRWQVAIAHPLPVPAERRLNCVAPVHAPRGEVESRNGLGAPLLL